MVLEAVGVEIALIFEVVLIVSFAVMGSITNDIVAMIRLKSNKINILKILASTFFASTLIFTLSITIRDHFGFRGLIFPSYLAGYIGFQILIKISTVNGLVNLVRDILDIVKDVVSIIDKRVSKSEHEKDDEVHKK